MRILALDLGTTTGWAIGTPDGDSCGSWKLATAKEITAQRRSGADRDADIRIPRLFERIKSAVDSHHIEHIFFEDVRFIKTTMQGQLWASLRSCVWLQTSPDGTPLRIVEFHAVPVQTLKKFATGWASATKEQMIHSARTKYPGTIPSARKFDDNMADALHLLHYGRDQLAR